MPVGVGVPEPPDAARQFRGEHHPDGDRGAVPPGVALGEFDGVAQGVAVVEDLPLAGFLEVLGDDPGLDRDGEFDELPDGVRAGIGDGGGILFDQVQDGRVGDEAALDDLGHAGDHLVLRQRVQGVEVTRTPAGGWNAPTRFLPSSVLMPVLPRRRRPPCRAACRACG